MGVEPRPPFFLAARSAQRLKLLLFYRRQIHWLSLGDKWHKPFCHKNVCIGYSLTERSSSPNQAREQPSCRSGDARRKDRASTQQQPEGHGGQDAKWNTSPHARPAIPPEIS